MATKIFCDICDKPADFTFVYRAGLNQLALFSGVRTQGEDSSVDLCQAHYKVMVVPAIITLKNLMLEKEKAIRESQSVMISGNDFPEMDDEEEEEEADACNNGEVESGLSL